MPPGHLSDRDLELVFTQTSPGAPLPESARQHLMSCADCQMEALERRFQRLKDLPAEPRSAGCPSEDLLLGLAAGTLQPDEGFPALTHAAGCGFCGAYLKDAIADLRTPLTAA